MKFRYWLGVYLCVAVLAWPVVSGWFFCETQGIFDADARERHARKNLGMSAAAGALYAGMWPFGMPLAFLLTGFAESGWALGDSLKCNFPERRAMRK